MNRKTVIKTIKIKLNEWLTTIADGSDDDSRDLVKAVRENIVLSGGCIATLFDEGKYNDFDVYIQDPLVLQDLAKYYIKKAKCNCNIGLKEGRISIDLNEIEKSSIKFDENGKYSPVFFSPNAITLSDDIQIILRFYGTPEQIHKTFDFVHAQNYFTFKEGLVTNVKSLESILTKQLIYNGSLYPITSIIRMRKFIKRGWNISAGEILKMALQISELDLTDIDVLKEQLQGVDATYFNMLISILEDIKGKNEVINSKRISEIIDNIFNEYIEKNSEIL